MEILKTTFDATSNEGLMKVFNATNGASQALKTAVGTVVEVEDILIYTDEVQGFGANAEPTTSKLVAIFDTNGTVFAGVSSVTTKASENLADMMLQNKNIKPKVTFVEGKSKGGQSFINLSIVSL